MKTLASEKKNLQYTAKNLSHSEKTFIMLDFDDTIFSRYEQLNGQDKSSILLKKNRGAAGNKVILHQIGIDNFIQKYYKNKTFPQILIKKLRQNIGMILTAGIEEIQNAKLHATELKDIPSIVVENAIQKPYILTKYILDTLKYIPNNIEIYEDRPQYFLENKKYLEEILQTNIKIFYVWMKDNNNPPKVHEVSSLEDFESKKIIEK